MADRSTHTNQLKQWFKIPSFHDEQWQVIDGLLSQKRIVFIAKTGFGKSLCYQYVAMARPGTTIVFSPLISLMRDQVEKLKVLGIQAESLNSSLSPEEKASISLRVAQGMIKILYIAPEQMDTKRWAELLQGLNNGQNINQVVIDEAHCISVWGHDFRPNYRKLINLVRLLPDSCPILACTATATPDVEKDIISQIGATSSQIRTSLIRPNIQIGTLFCADEMAKVVAMTHFIKSNKLGGGIIYTGTRTQAEYITNYLNSIEVRSICYHAGLGDERAKIEQDWKENKYKVIIATSALGMGVDKKDIDFVIHFQVPQSLIHYYQEFGRAGRGDQPAVALLLIDPVNDWSLPEAFTKNAKPPITLYNEVIASLKQEALSYVALTKKLNQKQTTIKVMLADLEEQKIVVKNGAKYEIVPPLKAIDTEVINKIRLVKAAMLVTVKDYVNLTTGRSQYLATYLGDKSLGANGQDFNTDYLTPIIEDQSNPARTWYNNYIDNLFPALDLPDAENGGFACGYYGNSAWGQQIKKHKYGSSKARFADFIVKRLARVYREKLSHLRYDYIVFVPPTESGTLVEQLAQDLSISIKVPCLKIITKAKTTQVQKAMLSGYTKSDNVKNAFAITNPALIQHKRILIIDDILDSGATIKEIGNLLKKSGAASFSALVLAKTAAQDD